MFSVWFICGIQDIYKELECKIVDFLGMEDIIFYVVVFDVNGGLFEFLLIKEDVIILDEFNYVFIIDGICLCKVVCYCYKYSDMVDLEEKFKEVQFFCCCLIVIDGVFFMDGDIVKLNEICDLVDKYDVMVMVDDCYVIGFIGKIGWGIYEFYNVMGWVDIIIGMFGKVLGGVFGGFMAVKKEIVDMLWQCFCLYLFFNILVLVIVGVFIEVFDILSKFMELCDKLEDNIIYFCKEMIVVGFDILFGEVFIVFIMLYDVKLLQDFVNCLFDEGIYVIGFFYLVVFKGKVCIWI